MFFLQDALKKGTGGWKKVVATFGDEILRSDGEVDRAKLGQIVFSDPGKRQILNRYTRNSASLSVSTKKNVMKVPTCRLSIFENLYFEQFGLMKLIWLFACSKPCVFSCWCFCCIVFVKK